MKNRFWGLLCSYLTLWKVIGMMAVTLLVLSIASATVIERGSPTYVIWSLNVGILVATLFGVAGVIWGCRRYEDS